MQTAWRALLGPILILEVAPKAVRWWGNQDAEPGDLPGCPGWWGGGGGWRIRALLNVGVFGVLSRHDAAALCYLHLGASGWDLRGPSPVSAHRGHL